MPIYEFQCTSCGHIEEVLQKISDDPLKDCPACEKPDMKKNVTAAAFRLSGGGWYETDFKNDNQKNLAGDKKDGDKKKTDGEKKSDGDKKDTGAKSESTSKSSDNAKSDSAKKSGGSGSKTPSKDS